MRQLWMRANQLLESANQTDMILARHQVAYREDKRRVQTKRRLYPFLRRFTGHGTKGRGNAIGQDYHFVFIQAVGAQNPASRKFTSRNHARGGFYGSANGAAKLQRSIGSEILRMLQKTYVVDAYNDRSRAEKRSRVLHM